MEAGIAGRRAVLPLTRRRCRTGLHRHLNAYETDSLIAVLGELRRLLGGQKVTLLWDGLPATAGVELANLAGDTLEEVSAAAERGIQRIRGTRTWPPRSCVTAACPYDEQ
jgi:hypothetical protein